VTPARTPRKPAQRSSTCQRERTTIDAGILPAHRENDFAGIAWRTGHRPARHAMPVVVGPARLAAKAGNLRPSRSGRALK
jgi:hypothetical protein